MIRRFILTCREAPALAFDSVDRPTLLLVADRLEARAKALPCWDPKSEEAWHKVADQQYEAEIALAAQIRAVPGSTLTMCATRDVVTLDLLGIRVKSRRGLGHACQCWVERVRADLGCLAAHAAMVISALPLAG